MLKLKNFYIIFWFWLSKFILEHKVKLITIVMLLTLLMGFLASKTTLSYELPKILPTSDKNFKVYEEFKARYGEDGNVMIVAVETKEMYKLGFFQKWYDLTQTIKKHGGIKNVLSLANIAQIIKDDSAKKFKFEPILKSRPETQAEVDSLASKISNLPFYDGFIQNGDAHIMAITFDQKILNDKIRIQISKEIQAIVENFGSQNKLETHLSGLPYIRTNFMLKVKNELILFMGLAFLITTAILYLFFKSARTVFIAVSVVLIGVVWSMGLMVLFGYQISILTGLIPPLIIVIGIPNTIFLINKYQEEFVKLKDKTEALRLSIEKIGKTTFIANLTTFIGFFVFYFTGSPLLLEFGLVASTCVMVTWAISLVLIPGIFSFISAPTDKHVKHLENKTISKFLVWVDHIVHYRRSITYWFICGLVLVSVVGLMKIKAIGYVVDDLPKNDRIYTDLKFVEKNFKGVVPIEVSIDTKEANGVFNPEVLNKIKALQKEFGKYPEFTRPVSIVEGLKFVYQAYRGGDAKYYALPPALELQNLAAYFKSQDQNINMLNAFVDKDKRFTRISFQSADAGTQRVNQLYKILQAKADTIFNYNKETSQWLPEAEKIPVSVTGNGIVFTQGNNYLLRNLGESTLLAIFLVCLVMATQFLNFRTILISTIPSIIPLIITAGIMGYFNIPLKPSTTLIFSIAFGIASDGTIYFLTKYKEEILNGKSISEAISETIKHTGLSMFYTAFILFFGFGIFIASGFKGTFFLGLLVSITLLIGMMANLILLPCFLMTLDKRSKR